MTDTFLTVEEAAKRLAVTPYTLREWLRAGKLRGVQVARRWRVPERALFELATATPTVTPTNAPKPNSEATAGRFDDFLKSVDALTQRMEAAGVEGVNGAELVREGREEREQQIGG